MLTSWYQEFKADADGALLVTAEDEDETAAHLGLDRTLVGDVFDALRILERAVETEGKVVTAAVSVTENGGIVLNVQPSDPPR